MVHTIANGEIRTLANKSKDFSYYVIDIGVGYDDDTDRIVEVVRDAARELMQDPAFAPSILEPLEVLGVDAFKATRGDAAVPDQDPAAQAVGRRPRAQAADQEGVRRQRHPPPGPQMTVTLKK